MTNRQEKVFKRLQEHIEELNRLKPDNELIMIAHYGSFNYNLDCNTPEHKSDVDSVAVVMPNMSDIINRSYLISETITLDNGENIDVKDIRLFLGYLEKCNLKYLEILLSDFKIINPKYKDIIESKLLSISNSIVSYDPVKLIKCIYGMALEKRSKLSKIKGSDIEYDSKNLHHLLRLALVMSTYINSNFDLKFALNACNYPSDMIDRLIDAKEDNFVVSTALSLASNAMENIEKMKDGFIENECEHVNKNSNRQEHVAYMLDSVSKQLFDRFLTNKLTINASKNEYKMPSLDKIFVTSDLHFGHCNMLTYEQKRLEELCRCKRCN